MSRSDPQTQPRTRAAGLLGGVSPMFYRPLASPLHATRAGVAALWATALGGAALVLYSPLALVALAAAILLAARGAGVGGEIGRALRMALVVALPIVVVNVLVARDGLTVFARIGDLGPFGQGDLTVEALVYGAVIALKVTILVLVSSLASLAVDPDELLRIGRRISFRSALTASLAIRMIPLLAADAGRLAEAQRTRPGADRVTGRVDAVRARGRILAAVVAGSLDRAMDVAATLEVRGLAAVDRRSARPRQRWFARRSPPARSPWSRHDLAFLASAFAVFALAVLGRLTGAAAFTAYPLLHVALGWALLALCAALVLALLLPFADRRGIQR